jgi:hypothetical protein
VDFRRLFAGGNELIDSRRFEWLSANKGPDSRGIERLTPKSMPDARISRLVGYDVGGAMVEFGPNVIAEDFRFAGRLPTTRAAYQ